MEKILVSACFGQINVRYDGKHNGLNHAIFTQWRAQQRLVFVCPEVCGGLATPRIAAEINAERIITKNSVDVSYAFKQGAEHALALCKAHNIRYALLKESSPSCGSQTIYDGSFSGTKIRGQGITTQILQQHGIIVFSEQTIEKLILLLDD